MALKFKSLAQTSEFQIQIAKLHPYCIPIWMSQRLLNRTQHVPNRTQTAATSSAASGPRWFNVAWGLGEAILSGPGCSSAWRASGPAELKEAFTFRAMLLTCLALVLGVLLAFPQKAPLVGAVGRVGGNLKQDQCGQWLGPSHMWKVPGSVPETLEEDFAGGNNRNLKWLVF